VEILSYVVDVPLVDKTGVRGAWIGRSGFGDSLQLDVEYTGDASG
jgi:hypothetical protein